MEDMEKKTAQIREEIYYSLISRRIFPKKQKVCRKRTRGREEILYIDQHKLSKSQEKINYLMYRDDKRFFAKNEKELQTLIQTVRI